MTKHLDENEKRLRDLEVREARVNEQERALLDRKNTDDYTMVFTAGVDRLNRFLKGDSGLQSAARLYTYLLENMEFNTGGVVCDQQYLADELGVSVRTVRRWVVRLEKEKALVRIPVAGKVCAYVLDSDECWRGYQKDRKRLSFKVVAVAGVDADTVAKLKRTLKRSKNRG